MDKEKREIRILLLQPSEEEDDALYADLEIVSLDSEPEYKAISYVWGDASDTTDMFLNGECVKITKSLAAALRRFRDPKDPAALWADAVCINQADLKERAEQVRIMDKIFAAAVQVNVWLGRLSDRAWHGSLYSYLEAHDLPRADDVLQKQEVFFEYLLPHVRGDLDIRTSRFGLNRWSIWLGTLSFCPWFSRLWVIQEVALARSAIFFSGRHSFTHDALSSIVKQVKLLESRPSPYNTLLRTAVHQVYPAVQAKNMALTRGACAIMRQCSHLSCSDDLDRVYSLLGLTSTVSDFPIDYQKTTAEVFIDFATSCIAREGPTPVFVTSACGRNDGELPSWVPDWRGGFIPYIDVFSNTARYHAACPAAFQGLASDRYLNFDKGKLKIRALVVDALETSVPSYCRVSRSESCREPKQVGCLYLKTFRQWMESLQNFQDSLVQVVCCNVWWDHGRLRKIVPEDCEKVERHWATINDAGTNHMDIPRGLDTMNLEVCVANAQLFLTTSGRLGNARLGVQTGDLVALFPGCSIPFIIRPVDDVAGQRAFKLVSPCYVHGIMNGEAVKGAMKANAKVYQLEESLQDFEAVHERAGASPGGEDLRARISEVAEKHFRHLFEEIVLV